MDSDNDALENMLLLPWNDERLKFLIKHNFRRENWFAIAEELKKQSQIYSVCVMEKKCLSEAPGVKFQQKTPMIFRLEWYMKLPNEQLRLKVRYLLNLKQKSICI